MCIHQAGDAVVRGSLHGRSAGQLGLPLLLQAPHRLQRGIAPRYRVEALHIHPQRRLATARRAAQQVLQGAAEFIHQVGAPPLRLQDGQAALPLPHHQLWAVDLGRHSHPDHLDALAAVTYRFARYQRVVVVRRTAAAPEPHQQAGHTYIAQSLHRLSPQGSRSADPAAFGRPRISDSGWRPR